MGLGQGKYILILKSNFNLLQLKLLNRLWSYEDKFEDWNQEGLDILPSDSSKRPDLNCLKLLEYEKSQTYKDEIENLQRKDKKNRESNSDK